MNEKHSLLVEFGIEELPSHALLSLSRIMEDQFKLLLHEARLNFGDIRTFATPRRLALLLTALDSRQPDETKMVRGPSVSVAFGSDGMPLGPAKGFASSCGVDIGDLDRMTSPKGEYLVFHKFIPGASVAELIPDFIEKTIQALSASKGMRWGATLYRFLRPVRWLTVLLDTEVIPCSVYGIQSDRLSYGHRVHCSESLELTHALEYEPRLEAHGFVIPCFHKRKRTIIDQVNSIAMSHKLTVAPSTELIDEITGLVEWPVALSGCFDESFLAVPHECLISTMESNQKFIAAKGPDGQLSNTFLFVANLESEDPEAVISGNERVIRPRFADAQFFFETDKRQRLESIREGLKRVIYHKSLGSMFEKTQRLAATTGEFVSLLGIDSKEGQLAGQLSKVDLLTLMVGEFPELQGIMGRYYALANGYSESLAQALEEQYLPRGQGDALPNSSLGIALSMADKFDGLVGFFAVGLEPSADKDPFALRRMALGIVRMCIELELNTDVAELAKIAIQPYDFPIENNLAQRVAEFIMQRLPTLYRDSGIDMRLVRAVEALDILNPCDFNKRLVVLQQFYRTDKAVALAEVHKRVNNILKKNKPESRQLVVHALTEPAELALHKALIDIEPQANIARENRDYLTLLELGSSLQGVVDQFFVDVKVMSSNPTEQNNRLSLLTDLQRLLAEVGDLSYLVASTQRHKN